MPVPDLRQGQPSTDKKETAILLTSMARKAVGRPKKAVGDTTRKPRKKKDKNAPKRALSAFMFFSNDIRDTVKKEMPELQFLEISSEIGRRWKKITADERRVGDKTCVDEGG